MKARYRSNYTETVSEVIFTRCTFKTEALNFSFYLNEYLMGEYKKENQAGIS